MGSSAGTGGGAGLAAAKDLALLGLATSILLARADSAGGAAGLSEDFTAGTVAALDVSGLAGLAMIGGAVGSAGGGFTPDESFSAGEALVATGGETGWAAGGTGGTAADVLGGLVFASAGLEGSTAGGVVVGAAFGVSAGLAVSVAGAGSAFVAGADFG